MTKIINSNVLDILKNLSNRHNAHCISISNPSLNLIIPIIKHVGFCKNILVSNNNNKFSFSIAGTINKINKFKEKDIMSKFVSFEEECLQITDEIIIKLFNNVDYQYCIDDKQNLKEYNSLDLIKHHIKPCDLKNMKLEFINNEKYIKGIIKIQNNKSMNNWKTIGKYYFVNENNKLIHYLEFEL